MFINDDHPKCTVQEVIKNEVKYCVIRIQSTNGCLNHFRALEGILYFILSVNFTT